MKDLAQPEKNPLAGLSPLKRALLAIEELQGRIAELERSRTEPIAIVGIGCRFPGAPNPRSFWQFLSRGGDGITEVPAARWSLEDYPAGATRWGGFLERIDQFDPEFFGISPREAHMMDPQQRLLLEVVWEALESGAQGPADWINGKTGVFIGVASDEYTYSIFRRGDLANFNAYFPTGIARSVAAGRISYVLGIEGPNFSIDSACSSSLVAVHNACIYLRGGQCRTAVAGGINVILAPEIVHSFSNAHMMSSDGRCKTFDSRADGFVRAEGCGIVVLKRLSDAVADRDRVLAVIRGSAINQDGHSAGLTVPSVHAQEAVIREALAAARLTPAQIDYIEAHGTGTSLGDPIEASALARVFSDGRPVSRPLVVGSVKSNFGHLEAAAGISGLIKTVLALQHEEIPPNLHFEQMNPHIDWGNLPVDIPVAGRPWRRGSTPRAAGVSSFGFSGTNAHVILEEAPPLATARANADRPLHVLALSARTPTALRDVAAQYAESLDRQDAPVADLCFSANACHAHFTNRIAVAGASASEIRSKLLAQESLAPSQAREGVRPVFLFPGQGAQYPGMGKELYETHPEFRRALDRCAELLAPELATPLTEVLWGAGTHLLDETAYTQPALFAVEYALAELWRSWGIEPGAVLGHSIGEYAAACIAGVFSLADGIKLIAARARLMQSAAGQGAMISVAAPEACVREALHGLSQRVSIAAINAPDSVVIAGYVESLAVAESRLREQNVRLQRLSVSHAFHSPQMVEIAERFAAVAAEVVFQPPRLKWISSRTGQPVSREEAAQPDYWRKQVLEPVRFQAAIEALDRLGNHVFLEAGPGTVLSSLGQQTIAAPDRVWLPSWKKGRPEWQQMLESLSSLYARGADVNWAAFDRPFFRRRVELPTYPFERRTFWFESPCPAKPKSASAGPDAPAQPFAPTPALFDIAWQPVTRSDQAAGAGVTRGNWLIVADRTGIAQDLADRLTAQGATVSLIESAAGLRALAGKSFASVAFLKALDAPPSDSLTPEVLETAQRDLCCAALELVHGLAASLSTNPPRLWLITRGVHAVVEDEPVSIVQSSLWGIGQSIADEYPEWNCTCVDLEAGDASAEALCQGFLSVGEEDYVAIRKGQCLALRIQAASPSHDVASPFEAGIQPGATYLIAGGFGGIGCQITRWLIDHGARTLVLTGRGALSGESHELIAWAESRGARIIPWQADISQYEQGQRLIADIAATLPPLRGVVQAAGVLDDGVLAEQTWPRFARVLAPKVAGSWNLHVLTESAPLDFFIFFSSVTIWIGAPGQSNYAAANAFEDALAQYRRSRGLPGQSIAWGAWAEGMAARDGLVKKRSAIGIGAMGAREAVDLFAKAATRGSARLIAGAFDWDRFAARYPSSRVPRRFDALVSGHSSAAAPASAPDLLAELAGRPQAAGLPILQNYMRDLAGRVLGFSAGREIDPSQPLQELGLDSLMAVEMRNSLSAALQRALPTTLLFSYPSLEDLTRFASGLLWATAPASPAPVDGAEGILDRLEQLSDEEMDRLLFEKFGTPNERFS